MAWTETTSRFTLHRCNLTQETFSRRMADPFWNILYMFLRVWSKFSAILYLDRYVGWPSISLKLLSSASFYGPNIWMKFFTFTISAIHILLHTSFVTQSDLQQAHSPFHRELYTECDLVLPLSSYSILFCSRSSSICLHLLSPLRVPSIFLAKTCCRGQFLRRTRLAQLAFLRC